MLLFYARMAFRYLGWHSVFTGKYQPFVLSIGHRLSTCRTRPALQNHFVVPMLMTVWGLALETMLMLTVLLMEKCIGSGSVLICVEPFIQTMKKTIGYL